MARRSLLALLALATFVVPSGFQPAAAGGSPEQVYERTDEVQAFGTTCEIRSRLVRYSDGSFEAETRVGGGLTSDCADGATAKVRFTYRNAEGDLRTGEATAPGLVNVTTPAGTKTEFRSFHSAAFSDGSQTAEFPLPK